MTPIINIMSHSTMTIKQSLKPIKTSSLFLLLILNACSVSNEQDNQVIVSESKTSESQQTNTQKIPEISNHQHPSQHEPQPNVVSYSETTPWMKPQAKLTHKQRFDGVLQAHNGVRIKHGLKPLKWSPKLAKYSQEWADYLGRNNHCEIKHRPNIPKYGENLYRSSALKWNTGKREVMAINIKEVVKAWTDEEKWYDYNLNRCQPGKLCGHYTQIVWKNTSEVGCAIKVCKDKSQTWVCSYDPPGNFTGMKPY